MTVAAVVGADGAEGAVLDPTDDPMVTEETGDDVLAEPVGAFVVVGTGEAEEAVLDPVGVSVVVIDGGEVVDPAGLRTDLMAFVMG